MIREGINMMKKKEIEDDEERGREAGGQEINLLEDGISLAYWIGCQKRSFYIFDDVIVSCSLA